VAKKSTDVRECARVGPRRAWRGAELIGRVHGAARGERGVRGNGSMTGKLGPRDRERERARAKETGADRLAPLGGPTPSHGGLGPPRVRTGPLEWDLDPPVWGPRVPGQNIPRP
jgi:hypothetical protein